MGAPDSSQEASCTSGSPAANVYACTHGARIPFGWPKHCWAGAQPMAAATLHLMKPICLSVKPSVMRPSRRAATGSSISGLFSIASESAARSASPVSAARGTLCTADLGARIPPNACRFSSSLRRLAGIGLGAESETDRFTGLRVAAGSGDFHRGPPPVSDGRASDLLWFTQSEQAVFIGAGYAPAAFVAGEPSSLRRPTNGGCGAHFHRLTPQKSRNGHHFDGWLQRVTRGVKSTPNASNRVGFLVSAPHRH